MGLTFIQNTLEKHENVTIYHLNRGNDYWGYKIQKLHDEFKHRIRHLKCNRKQREEFYQVVLFYLFSGNKPSKHENM